MRDKSPRRIKWGGFIENNRQTKPRKFRAHTLSRNGNNETEVCAYGQRVCEVCQANCTLGPGAEVAFCGDGVVNGPEECDGGDNCNDDCTTVPPRGDGQYGDPCDCGIDCATGICLGAARGPGHCSNRCVNHLHCAGDSLCRTMALREENDGCADPGLGLGEDRVADVCVPNETGLPCEGPEDCLFGSLCLDQSRLAPNLTIHRICGARCDVNAECPDAYRCDPVDLAGARVNVCQPRAELRPCPDGTTDQCVGVCPLDPGEVEVDVSQCSSGQAGVAGYCTCACRSAADCPAGFACTVAPARGDEPPAPGTCTPIAGFTCPAGADGHAACPSDLCHDPGEEEGLPLCTAGCADAASCPDGYHCEIDEGRDRGYCLP